MISAIALLNLGISNRSAGIAHVLRSLAAEYRLQDTSEERKANIRTQIPFLLVRFTMSARAQWALYTAMVCFVGTVLTITLDPGAGNNLKLGLFVAGIVLALVAVILESAEISTANRTLKIDLVDVLGEVGVTRPPSINS
jgi:4-hydroxybenzoate polyprenyltransferase